MLTVDDVAALFVKSARSLEKLREMYQSELGDAQWTRRSGVPSSVSSSSGRSDPTTTVAGVTHRERRAEAVAADVDYMVGVLERMVERHSRKVGSSELTLRDSS